LFGWKILGSQSNETSEISKPQKAKLSEKVNRSDRIEERL